MIWILSTDEDEQINDRIITMSEYLDDVVSSIKNVEIVEEIKDYFNSFSYGISSSDIKYFEYNGKHYKIYAVVDINDN